MHKTLDFLVFCIEEYKNTHGFTGEYVVELFDKYQVFAYLLDCYEALHTMGTQFIVDDIDGFIGSKA